MRHKNLAVLDRITLGELERVLNAHTLKRIPVDEYTDFSWSISRHTTFEECRRRYYLHYYASRRVREAGDELVSAIWWLKQLTNLPLWIGSLVHDVAAAALRAHRAGKFISTDLLRAEALTDYQAGIRASSRGAKHYPTIGGRQDKRGSWVVLFEHIYGAEDFDAQIAEGERRLAGLVDALFASAAYDRIMSLPPAALAEIDRPFQSYPYGPLPGIGIVRMFAIPDVLLAHDGRITIYDWKTGGVEYDHIRLQAGVYRLYAHLQYGLPEDAIDVLIADLNGGGVSVNPPGGVPSLQEARALVESSMLTMIEQMDDQQYNTVAVASSPLTQDLSLCCYCAFKRACWREDVC